MKKALLMLIAVPLAVPASAEIYSARLRVLESTSRILTGVFPGQTQALSALSEDDSDRQWELDRSMLREAEYDRFDKVQVLLVAGARVDAADRDGRTALMWASSHQRAWAVRMLLGKGASVDLPDKGGRTALMLAAEYADLQQSNETLAILIAAKAEVNAPDKEGNTALMIAAGQRSSSSLNEPVGIKFLLEKGALIELKNKQGETALMLAAKAGNTEIAKVLIEKGADVNAKTVSGVTSLMMAAESWNYSTLDYLAGVKAVDLNAKDGTGGTALLRAAKLGYGAQIRSLVDHGADKNLPGHIPASEFGPELGLQTALMTAALEGKVEAVKVLIEKKADFIYKDYKSGHTALSLAKLYGADPDHQEIVKLLQEAGAGSR